MNLKSCCACGVALLALASAGPAAEHGWAGALRASANGRSLIDAAGRPVFLLGDTAWALATRTTREQAEHYLRTRRAQRFNAVTFVLFVPGTNEITKGLANAYGDEPFVRAGNRADPTRPVVTPGSDPRDAAAYDYWDHVDFLVGLTRRLGMHALILPTWGSGIVGSYNGKAPDGVTFDETNARTYGRWVAARYRHEPHVIWMLGGDRAAVEGPKDFRPIFRAMAAGIGEAAPDALISYHPRKNAPQSGAFFHDDAWLDFNSIQEWPDRQIGAVREDWERTPPKPTWLFEGRYEAYWRGNYKAEDWGEWQVRQQAYQTVLAGAFGHTYGHERVFGFGNDGVDWTQHLDSPGARSMTHLAKLMSGFAPEAILGRVPDQTLLDGGEGRAERTKSDRITALRTVDGQLAIFYTASGRPVRVRLERLAAGPLSAAWFNPRTGRWRAGERETEERAYIEREVDGGARTGAKEFVPPTNGAGEDWVLVLESRVGR